MLLPITRFKRTAILVTTTALMLSTGTLLLHAFNPQPDPPIVFGVFGITPVDVIRLNVTNVAGSFGLLAPPCRAHLAFVNADGVEVKSEDVIVADGHTASLSLNFLEASGGFGALATRPLLNVRPVVNFLAPPCYTAVSAEVADAFSGRTNIHASPELKLPAQTTNTLTDSAQ